MSSRLRSTGRFGRSTVLTLDEKGQFIEPDTGRQLNDRQAHVYLQRSLAIDSDVTDIFVWVHGWRNNHEQAISAAERLFDGIETVYLAQPARYPQLHAFKGMYIAVCWPSWSSVMPWGYMRIRDRAHLMTERGYAEYVLAALLGYLDEQRRTPPAAPGTLPTASGQYLHCVGHSFGGRFLAQAIAAAATPQPPTLPLLDRNEAYQFTVDNFLAFQMAAEPGIFRDRLRPLLSRVAPLQGPVCLTYTSADRANCVWHRLAEGCRGIGCQGSERIPDLVKTVRLRPIDEDYTAEELSGRIVNVNANWRYRRSRWSPQGAHSDFWYKESIHLLLTLANLAR